MNFSKTAQEIAGLPHIKVPVCQTFEVVVGKFTI